MEYQCCNFLKLTNSPTYQFQLFLSATSATTMAVTITTITGKTMGVDKLGGLWVGKLLHLMGCDNLNFEWLSVILVWAQKKNLSNLYRVGKSQLEEKLVLAGSFLSCKQSFNRQRCWNRFTAGSFVPMISAWFSWSDDPWVNVSSDLWSIDTKVKRCLGEISMIKVYIQLYSILNK